MNTELSKGEIVELNKLRKLGYTDKQILQIQRDLEVLAKIAFDAYKNSLSKNKGISEKQ